MAPWPPLSTRSHLVPCGSSGGSATPGPGEGAGICGPVAEPTLHAQPRPPGGERSPQAAQSTRATEPLLTGTWGLQLCDLGLRPSSGPQCPLCCGETVLSMVFHSPHTAAGSGPHRPSPSCPPSLSCPEASHLEEILCRQTVPTCWARGGRRSLKTGHLHPELLTRVFQCGGPCSS